MQNLFNPKIYPALFSFLKSLQFVYLDYKSDTLFNNPPNTIPVIFSTSDKNFMEYCLMLAGKAAASDEIPVGACIVKDNVIIGSGFNRNKSNKDSTAHAEIIAIREACRNLKSDRLDGATLFVTLEPCAMCAAAAVTAKLSTLIFGAFDPKSGACGSLYNIVQDARLNHSLKVYSGLLEEPCGLILKEFFRNRRFGA